MADESAQLDKLLAEHSKYFTRTEDGKVKCECNGHQFPPRLDVLSAFIQGKKFATLRKRYDAENVLTKYEPFIVQSKNFPNMLYCSLTRQLLDKSVEAVKVHMKGKKFQYYKELFASDKKELQPEPDIDTIMAEAMGKARAGKKGDASDEEEGEEGEEEGSDGEEEQQEEEEAMGEEEDEEEDEEDEEMEAEPVQPAAAQGKGRGKGKGKGAAAVNGAATNGGAPAKAAAEASGHGKAGKHPKVEVGGKRTRAAAASDTAAAAPPAAAAAGKAAKPQAGSKANGVAAAAATAAPAAKGKGSGKAKGKQPAAAAAMEEDEDGGAEFWVPQAFADLEAAVGASSDDEQPQPLEARRKPTAKAAAGPAGKQAGKQRGGAAKQKQQEDEAHSSDFEFSDADEEGEEGAAAAPAPAPAPAKGRAGRKAPAQANGQHPPAHAAAKKPAAPKRNVNRPSKSKKAKV